MPAPRAILIHLLLAGACAGRAERPAATVELWLGGDTHVGAGGSDLLAPLAPVLAGRRGIVNLEGAVGEGAAASTAERLVNAPPALAALREGGVTVVGIANNHAGDLGPAGMEASARAVERAGLVAAGGPAGAAVLDVGGARVVVTAHDLGAGVPPDLAADLAAARGRGDVLVATFHITGPPSYLPRPELRAAVDLALAAGARVVAAHGTHALGPVERRGDAVIAWGLGNLLFDCACSREAEGLILAVSIPPRGPVEATVIPIDAGIDGRPARPAADPALALDLLRSIESSPLERLGDRARF